jgi:hypothetical protein
VPAASCGVAPTAVGATDVAFGAGGHIYVTDGYCNGRIVELDAAGRRVREWGARGSGRGELNVAHSIAVSGEGIVFVADRENGRVQRFDPSGRLLGMWNYGPQVFSVAFGPSGELYMSVRAPGAADTDMHITRIDPADGTILGVISIRSHEMGVAPDGALLPGTRNARVTLFVPASGAANH